MKKLVLNRAVHSLLTTALLLTQWGCGGGAVLVGLFSDSGGSSSGGAPAVPLVSQLSIATPVTPERVLVDFQVESGNGDTNAGALTTRIEFEVLEVVAEAQPKRLRGEATPTSDSASLDSMPPGQTTRFVWDARADLGVASAMVVLVVTPKRDDVEGPPFRSRAFRAGNTPVQIAEMDFLLSGDIVQAVMELRDAESDRVQLLRVEAEVGETELEIPLSIIDHRDFPSSAAGEPTGFGFRLSELNHPVVSAPGFRDEVTFRVSVDDFPGGEPASSAVTFLLDNNEPPVVEVLPVPRYATESGVIPIHYRLFDPDLNPANLEVRVDLGDGAGFRPAVEFPNSSAPVRTDLTLETLDPAGFGDPTNPFRTFFWDAFSQGAVEYPSVRVSLQASNSPVTAPDRELGLPSILGLSGFTQPVLSRVREVEIGSRVKALLPGDYDGDGFRDVVVVYDSLGGDDYVTYLRGASGGLSRVRDVAIADKAGASARGDFNGDGFPDVVVVNKVSATLTYLTGGSEGLSRVGEIEVGAQHEFEHEALATGDFDGDGFVDVMVANHESGSVTHVRGSSEGLQKVTDLPFRNPLSLLSGDFNGDGLADVVVIYDRGGGPCASLLSWGTDGLEAGFCWGLHMSAPAYRSRLSGDFDRDGFEDVVVVGTGVLNYLRGGKEGLERGELGRFAPSNPDRILLARGDFNGDDFQDLVIVDEGQSRLSFFLGASEGLPEFPNAFFRLGVGDRPVAVVTADFDGDDFDDVVVANFGSDGVTHFRGGAEGPQLTAEFPVGRNPVSLLASDVDDDGFADVVVAAAESGDLTFLLGGPRGLSPAGTVSAGGDSGSIRARMPLLSGDFDGNGSTDVVVASWIGGQVTHVRGAVSGLVSETTIAMETFFWAPLSRDFNGDGVADVVALSGSELVYLRGGSEGISRQPRISVGEGPRFVLNGDFNGDGYGDLVVSNSDSNDVTYIRGGRNGLSRVGEIAVGKGPRYSVSGNFDGDGFADVAVANMDSSDVTWLRGGKNGLVRMREIAVGSHYSSQQTIVSSDFDGDGFGDVVVTNPISDSITLLKGGDDGLSRAGRIAVGKRPRALLCGDFNGDGHADLVVANGGSDDVTFLRGEGDGLSRVGEVAAGDDPAFLHSGDFDSDGFEDVVVVNFASQDVTYLRGASGGLVRAGEFAADPLWDDFVDFLSLSSADYDGDGFVDLVLANRDHLGSVTYFRGGSGGLSLVSKMAPGSFPNDLLSGDFDGDGFVDLLVSYGGDDTVTYLRGGTKGLSLAGRAAAKGAWGLSRGDFDCDGFEDVVIGGSSGVTMLRQRHFRTHANAFVTPEALQESSVSIVDPRSPLAFRLDLPAGSVVSPTHVTVVPAPTFPLPNAALREARTRGMALATAAHPVSVMRETTLLKAPARLTLRLRDDSRKLTLDRLRVFRLDRESGAVAEAGLAAADFEIVDLGRGRLVAPAVSFPIARFGTYLLAEERPLAVK